MSYINCPICPPTWPKLTPMPPVEAWKETCCALYRIHLPAAVRKALNSIKALLGSGVCFLEQSTCPHKHLNAVKKCCFQTELIVRCWQTWVFKLWCSIWTLRKKEISRGAQMLNHSTVDLFSVCVCVFRVVVCCSVSVVCSFMKVLGSKRAHPGHTHWTQMSCRLRCDCPSVP